MISKTESGRVSKEIPGSGSGSGTRWALIWSGGSVSAIGRLCKLPIFGIFDLCNITRSESTLKSIKLQYGAEIDGWRAKYEEAQVKI